MIILNFFDYSILKGNIKSGNGINFSIFNLSKSFFSRILNFSLVFATIQIFLKKKKRNVRYTRNSNFENNYPWNCRDPFFPRRRDETIFHEKFGKFRNGFFYLRFRSPPFSFRTPCVCHVQFNWPFNLALVKTVLRHNVARLWNDSAQMIRHGRRRNDSWRLYSSWLAVNIKLSDFSTLINPFWTEHGAWVHLDALWTIFAIVRELTLSETNV